MTKLNQQKLKEIINEGKLLVKQNDKKVYELMQELEKIKKEEKILWRKLNEMNQTKK